MIRRRPTHDLECKHLLDRVAKGFTLVELMVSVGLFAIVMMLAAGAYLVVIRVNQQAQGNTTAINNLAFALDSMVRTIRTGTGYGCISAGADCPSGGSSFYVTAEGALSPTHYYLNGPAGAQYIVKTVSGATYPITDPANVKITSLTFILKGAQSYSASGDLGQPYVTILVTGTVLVGPNKTQSFTVQTSAVMRGTDL